MSKVYNCPECGEVIEKGANRCPNCGFPVDQSFFDNATVEEEKTEECAPTCEENFWRILLCSVLHFLYRLVYFLFILPFDIWKKAVVRMYNQKKSKSLDADKIRHEVPFFVWIKRYVFDFLLDGIAIISWLFSLIVVIAFFKNIGTEAHSFNGFLNYFFGSLIVPTFLVYWLPVTIALLRDAITLFIIMPTRWIFSFLRRPAKTYDLTHKQEK